MLCNSVKSSKPLMLSRELLQTVQAKCASESSRRREHFRDKTRAKSVRAASTLCLANSSKQMAPFGFGVGIDAAINTSFCDVQPRDINPQHNSKKMIMKFGALQTIANRFVTGLGIDDLLESCLQRHTRQKKLCPQKASSLFDFVSVEEFCDILAATSSGEDPYEQLENAAHMRKDVARFKGIRHRI